jgi:hypothetical protein
VIDGIEGALGGPLGPVLLTVLLLLALGWYLSYLAARLDRLHHRVESSRVALQARLAARASIAREAGRLLDAPDLVTAASRALGGPPDGRPEPGDGPRRRAGERPGSEPPVDEVAESELTRCLHRALAGRPAATDPDRPSGPAVAEVLDELLVAGDRVQLARRFHNDAVAHTQRMRRKRVVRWARLAGRAAMPQMVEMDDSRPNGLGWDA